MRHDGRVIRERRRRCGSVYTCVTGDDVSVTIVTCVFVVTSCFYSAAFVVEFYSAAFELPAAMALQDLTFTIAGPQPTKKL